MGYQKGGTFAHYVSVRDDTQSVFIETPTRDSLIKLATNASLTRDVSVPQRLTPTQKQAIEKESGLIDLRSSCDLIRRDLITQFHQLKIAKEADDPHYHQIKKLQAQIRAKRKQLHNTAKKKVQKDFFKNIGNIIIERNYHGDPITFKPDTTHIQPERKALADLEFKNRDVDGVEDAELVEDRIQSLELRLELHRLHIPPPLTKRIKFGLDVSKTDQTKKDAFLTKSSTGLECPVYLGHSDLYPSAKSFCYTRKDTLQKHFNTHRLLWIFGRSGRQCDFPGYLEVLFTLARYKSHLASCHNISL